MRYILPLLVVAAMFIFFENFSSLIFYFLPLILIMLLPKRKGYTDTRRIVPPKNLNNMDGFTFEHYVAQIFRDLGYKAEVTQESGDFGADVILTKEREKICVQCKRYKGLVGIAAVQEVLGSINYYNANRGCVVTNSRFTEAAVKLAKANHIELIDGNKLEKLIKKGKNRNIYKA